MIWLAILLVAVLAMAPLGFGLLRAAAARGRREAALTLHRAQLLELDRDLADGRIAAQEHATALLEIQRRLLAAAEDHDAPAPAPSRAPLLVVLGVVPLAALALYLAGGVPWLPSMPNGPQVQAARRQAQQEQALLPVLRQRVAALDQHSEEAREGYVLIGGAEARQGNMAEAANAWRTALGIRFDPTLAMETAEAITESQGRLNEEAIGLFHRALAEAPPDAPWRTMAEKRLSQAGANEPARSNQ